VTGDVYRKCRRAADVSQSAAPSAPPHDLALWRLAAGSRSIRPYDLDAADASCSVAIECVFPANRIAAVIFSPEAPICAVFSAGTQSSARDGQPREPHQRCMLYSFLATSSIATASPQDAPTMTTSTTPVRILLSWPRAASAVRSVARRHVALCERRRLELGHRSSRVSRVPLSHCGGFLGKSVHRDYPRVVTHCRTMSCIWKSLPVRLRFRRPKSTQRCDPSAFRRSANCTTPAQIRIIRPCARRPPDAERQLAICAPAAAAKTPSSIRRRRGINLTDHYQKQFCTDPSLSIIS